MRWMKAPSIASHLLSSPVRISCSLYSNWKNYWRCFCLSALLQQETSKKKKRQNTLTQKHRLAYKQLWMLAALRESDNNVCTCVCVHLKKKKTKANVNTVAFFFSISLLSLTFFFCLFFFFFRFTWQHTLIYSRADHYKRDPLKACLFTSRHRSNKQIRTHTHTYTVISFLFLLSFFQCSVVLFRTLHAAIIY